MSLTAEDKVKNDDSVALAMIKMHMRECVEHRKDTIERIKETRETIEKINQKVETNFIKINKLVIWLIIIVGGTGGGGIALNDNILHIFKSMFN